MKRSSAASRIRVLVSADVGSAMPLRAGRLAAMDETSDSNARLNSILSRGSRLSQLKCRRGAGCDFFHTRRRPPGPILGAMERTTGSDMAKNTVQELEAQLLQGKSAVECLGILVSLAELHAATFHNREGLRCAREALNITHVRVDLRSAARPLVA